MTLETPQLNLSKYIFYFRFVTENQHVFVGRMDGCNAWRRDRIRVRPSPEYVPAVQLEGARAQSQNDAGFRQIRHQRVSRT